MWFSVSIFGLGFLGIVALFAFKTVELRRAATTPLTHLRENGDQLVTERWRRLREMLRSRAARLLNDGYHAAWAGAHAAATRLQRILHSLSVRFGEYLTRNGATGEKKGHASTYVKDMLEYKLNAERTRLPAEASAQAGTDADVTRTEENGQRRDSNA